MEVGLVTKNTYLEVYGKHNNIEYVVAFQSGGWRTAYINITGTPLEILDYMECDKYIGVHGGFTWKDCRLPFEKDDTNKVWLGWDYAHYGDGYDLKSLKRYFGEERATTLITLYSGTGVIYSLRHAILDCIIAIDKLLTIKEI